jgi:hypothetical protein
VNGSVDPTLEELGRDGGLEAVDGVYVGVLADGDLFSHSYNSGGGFGDPLDRDPAAVERDLHRGLVGTEVSEAVNGVVVRDVDGVLRVDGPRTADKRDEIRRRRLEESIPVSEWQEGQRQRLEHEALDPVVVRMYRECRALSPKWWREFTSFWGLPDDFQLLDAAADEVER